MSKEIDSPGGSVAALVTDHERKDKNKKCTVYKVVVGLDGKPITVFRRYNEFLTLQAKLKKTYPEAGTASLKLPGRKLFGTFDPQVIRTRRDAIKEFTEKLFNVKQFFLSSDVQSFFNLDSSRPSSCEQYETDDEAYFSMDPSLQSSRRNSFSEDSKLTEVSSKMKPSDFEFLKVVGRGSFGKVFLARQLSDNKCYAIKVLAKSHVLANNEVRHIMCERSVLVKNSAHPFLVGLHYSFQTNEKLYLVMDYANGGELFFHLQKERRFTETRARFYAAEIASALGFLHSHHIIYRDLKPENILLDSQGHIALTDFGLCKEGNCLASTFCGTPEYLAPEVLERKSYDRMVDWWCLGAVLYELLLGLPPFYSRDREEMFRLTLQKPLEFKYDIISDSAKDILTKLLAKDKRQRLGAQNDLCDVRDHVFFNAIDWALLDERKIRPPFVPNLVEGQIDVSNFDPEFTRLQVTDSVAQPRPCCSQMPTTRRTFEGFSYVAPEQCCEEFYCF